MCHLEAELCQEFPPTELIVKLYPTRHQQPDDFSFLKFSMRYEIPDDRTKPVKVSPVIVSFETDRFHGAGALRIPNECLQEKNILAIINHLKDVMRYFQMAEEFINRERMHPPSLIDFLGMEKKLIPTPVAS